VEWHNVGGGFPFRIAVLIFENEAPTILGWEFMRISLSVDQWGRGRRPKSNDCSIALLHPGPEVRTSLSHTPSRSDTMAFTL
jgi:hypothetical protein